MTEKNALSLPETLEYKDLFEMADTIKEDEVFIKPGCKLCNSALRADAEAYCERVGWNYLSTEKWLTAKGEKITDKSIKNHIEDHYRPQVKRIQVKHYCNDLANYMRVKRDSLSTVALLQAALTKEFLEIASTSNALNPTDRLKTADMLGKLSNQILGCVEAERKNNEEFRPIHVAAATLQQIIQQEAVTATPEVRDRLFRVVDTFINKLDNIKIDKA